MRDPDALDGRSTIQVPTSVDRAPDYDAAI